MGKKKNYPKDSQFKLCIVDETKEHLHEILGITEARADELARYAVDVLRRTVLHYGIWFNEVVHQLGLEEAIRLEDKVSSSFLPIAINRLSRAIGFQTEDGLPLWLANMEKEKLVSLINAMSANWLTTDDLVVPVQVFDKDQLAALMEEQEVILSF